MKTRAEGAVKGNVVYRIECKLYSHSICPHVQQIYTGFKMLADSGWGSIHQEIRPPVAGSLSRQQHLRSLTDTHLKVDVRNNSNEKLTLYFDTHDSKEIDPVHLEACDFYFKRSYSSRYVAECHPGQRHKIHPLGLNYFVLPDRVDSLALQRNLFISTSVRERMHGLVRALDTGSRVMYHARVDSLHAPPEPALEPRVLFMVTAYDPHDDPTRSPEKIEERIHNNELRAACVRRLRKALGPRFHGGFMLNDYTAQHYRDVLVDDPAETRKGNYLRLLRRFPICIATTGLHGSIGWKLAEYVAFSRAIVSEELKYELPGHFAPGENYLPFSSPENCVEQSMRLMEDAALRERLMRNNFLYYQHHVRPDMLVFNAISTAMKLRQGH